jgi:phage tail-like protein
VDDRRWLREAERTQSARLAQAAQAEAARRAEAARAETAYQSARVAEASRVDAANAASRARNKPAPRGYEQPDPIITAGFWLDVGVPDPAAVFTEVSGLKVETETEEYHEGGRNDIVYRLPTRTKWSPITIRRGWTSGLELWTWYQQVIRGDVRPRNCSISMGMISGPNAGVEKARINIQQAFPTSWTGPDFKIDGNSVGFEAIVLTHMGFTIEKATG